MIPTIIICAALAAIVVAIVYRLIRNKRQGKSSCGCGCSSCAMQEICHKKKEMK